MKRVLVIGDVIEDEIIDVSSSRSSQEDPSVPVWDVEDCDRVPGGAANVAANMKALSDDVEVFSAGISETIGLSYRTPTKCPLKKTRYFKDGKLIARVDTGRRFVDYDLKCFDNLFKSQVLPMMIRGFFDLVVVSDYDKGSLDNIGGLIVPNAGSAPVIVDSKREDITMFKGAHVLNVNIKEYQMHRPCNDFDCLEELFDNVVTTCGESGAVHSYYSIHASGYTVHHEPFAAESVDAVDVTGCGDTFTAALSVGLLRDPLGIRDAIRFANECASLAVQMKGTARISKWDYSASYKS